MSTSFARLSGIATAIAAALVTLPVTAPTAAADPPRWAPAHGHHKFRHKGGHYRHRHAHKHRHWRHREVRRTVYYSRPVYRHYHDDDDYYYRPRRHRHGSDVSISPTLGGAIIGGLLGGLGGSQIGKGSGRTAAIIGGVAAGAVIGGSIGRSMEQSDRAQVQRTLETARTGQTIIWNNPDTGNRYEVTPTRTYRTAGRDCREYTSWVFLGGYEEQVKGTACRMPDGTWQRQPG